MRTLTRRVAALAIVSTLTLAGCGGSDDAPSVDDLSSSTTADPTADPTDGAEPASGKTIEGTGYSFSLPEGWDVPSQSIPGTGQTDAFAADLTDDDGFADNVNVIRLDPAPLDDLDQLEKALVTEIEGAGSKNVRIGDRATIDGVEAVHIDSELTQQGATYQAEQYNAIRDGISYVVTFSFSDTVSQQDRDDLAASVLAGWAWAA